MRRFLGLKPDRRRINNLDKGYKPVIDSRYLNLALKQQRNYNQRKKFVPMERLNDEKVLADRVEYAIQAAERTGKLDDRAYKDMMKRMVEEGVRKENEDKEKEVAGRSMKTAVGNARLAQSSKAKPVNIYECKF
jgi:hypothetical protein